MASTTYRRISVLPRRTITHPDLGELVVVKNFGVFVDTHRDLPHVGSFEDDLHRGTCKPVVVHFWRTNAQTYDSSNSAAVTMARNNPNGVLVHAVNNRLLPLHDSHRFVTTGWWQNFIQEYILDFGVDSFAPDGSLWLSTSKLRDPRRGVYKLKSFRQIVMDNVRNLDAACWRD